MQHTFNTKLGKGQKFPSLSNAGRDKPFTSNSNHFVNLPTINRQTILFASLYLLAGCSAPGSLILQHNPQQSQNMSTTPASGTYALFVAGEDDPAMTLKLDEGQKIGFQQIVGGTVNDLRIAYFYAVAGDRRLRLDVTKTYQWRKL